MSRSRLYLRALICRFLQNLGRQCDNYLSFPIPLRPLFKKRIVSTVGTHPGSFEVLFYAPPGYKRPFKSSSSQKLLSEKLPLLINFHGGGYTIGDAADDARWATAVIQKTPCVVASVSYRLAPAHPFPTGIEDCVSAILYIWANADALGIDSSRTALSGFSAGGNFCFTVPFRLHQELARLRRDQKEEEWMKEGKLVALAPFYPAVDWTRTRAARAATNPNAKPLMPSLLNSLFFGLFDDAYLYPHPEDMSVPLLSPGLAPDEMLREQLPENIVMMTCEGDSLLKEGNAFRERLLGVGKTVKGYTVEGVPHGWDKWPSWWFGEVKRDQCYEKASEALVEFWGL